VTYDLNKKKIAFVQFFFVNIIDIRER